MIRRRARQDRRVERGRRGAAEFSPENAPEVALRGAAFSDEDLEGFWAALTQAALLVERGEWYARIAAAAPAGAPSSAPLALTVRAEGTKAVRAFTSASRMRSRSFNVADAGKVSLFDIARVDPGRFGVHLNPQGPLSLWLSPVAVSAVLEGDLAEVTLEWVPAEVERIPPVRDTAKYGLVGIVLASYHPCPYSEVGPSEFAGAAAPTLLERATWELWNSSDTEEIIVVVDADASPSVRFADAVVQGGRRRIGALRSALEVLPADRVAVGIHDPTWAFVNGDVCDRAMDAVRRDGAAAAVPVLGIAGGDILAGRPLTLEALAANEVIVQAPLIVSCATIQPFLSRAPDDAEHEVEVLLSAGVRVVGVAGDDRALPATDPASAQAAAEYNEE